MTKFKNVESRVNTGRPSTATKRPESASGPAAQRQPDSSRRPPTHVAFGKAYNNNEPQSAAAQVPGLKLTEGALKQFNKKSSNSVSGRRPMAYDV